MITIAQICPLHKLPTSFLFPCSLTFLHKPHLIGNFHNFNNHFKKPFSLNKARSNMQQTCKKNLQRRIVKKRPCSMPMTMMMVIYTFSNASFFLEALKNLISTHNVANKVVKMELSARNSKKDNQKTI